MGNYTDLTKDYVRRFKPAVEEKAGLDLGELIVRERNPEIDEFDFPMQADTENNTIIVSENVYKRNVEIMLQQGLSEKLTDHNIRFDIQHGSLHELSHLVHNKLISRYFLNKVFHVSFEEGFAVYTSLEYLSDIYDSDFKKNIKNTKKFFNKPSKYLAVSLGFDYDPFHRGYKFFKETLQTLGNDRLFEVGRTIPENEEELIKPGLYLKRFLKRTR